MPKDENTKGKGVGAAEAKGDKGKAEGKGQGMPDSTPQESPTPPQQEWRTYWDRQQEREERGEWGTAGTQHQQWNERWKASRTTDEEQSNWRGKYSQK